MTPNVSDGEPNSIIPSMKINEVAVAGGTGSFFDTEDQIQLDRHDEPRRLVELGIELARPPARVPSEHERALGQRTRREHAPQEQW